MAKYKNELHAVNPFTKSCYFPNSCPAKAYEKSISPEYLELLFQSARAYSYDIISSGIILQVIELTYHEDDDTERDSADSAK